MNKYVVAIHIPTKALEPGFYEGDVEYSRAYMEEFEADYFTASAPNDTNNYGLAGVRFYVGEEMVAFYDARLQVSVVKGEIEEDDDERE